MDANDWNSRVFKSTSRRYQSHSDLYDEYEEVDVDEEAREDYACPFCYDDFDIVGLCCHIDDEHPVEAKNGLCPICGMWVGVDMVGHIATQHGQFFKMQRKRRSRKGGSQSNLAMLKKELRDGNLQDLLGGSSTVLLSNSTADPLLSSFINNLPMIDEQSETMKSPSFVESDLVNNPDVNLVERTIQPSLSEKEQEERAIRSEFVQGLLLSTMFDDIL